METSPFKANILFCKNISAMPTNENSSLQFDVRYDIILHKWSKYGEDNFTVLNFPLNEKYAAETYFSIELNSMKDLMAWRRDMMLAWPWS